MSTPIIRLINNLEVIRTNSLKEYRKKKGFTQAAVAEILNLSQAQYYRLESGKSLMNSNQIIEMCKLYSCTPNDLLDFKQHYQIIMSEVFDEKK